MHLQEVSTERVTASAFCRSSAELWWSLRPEPSTEVALQVLHDGAVQIEALCRCVSVGASSLRAYLTHLQAWTMDRAALDMLLGAIGTRHATAGQTTMVAFVEVETTAAAMLEGAGWTFERRFPVQLRWSLLGDPSVHMGERSPPLRIEETSDVDCAASLFVDAFWDQWQWYFEEMGYQPEITTSVELHQLARQYVEGADAYLIGTIDSEPVALSSVLVDKRSELGIFHTGVGVLPKARRQGLGQIMVHESLHWLRSRGIGEAEIRTQERIGQRNSNIIMYESTGAERQRCFWLCSGPPNAGR